MSKRCIQLEMRYAQCFEGQVVMHRPFLKENRYMLTKTIRSIATNVITQDPALNFGLVSSECLVSHSLSFGFSQMVTGGSPLPFTNH